MQGATKVALVAAIGNFLQGWDNAAIAGALLYMRKEFNLASNPALEGFLVAAALIGSWCMSVCAGPTADWVGRKLVLVAAACLYSISACAIIWSPNVNCIIVARIIDGLAIGLVVTCTPIYIAEVAPAEIRGQLATFPQLMGSAGLFLSYIMVFSLSLAEDPAWRLMLGVLLLPSLVYLGLLIFYLPESPRWIVSKGRMFDAKNVLKQLRDREDVSAELALLVEGLGTGIGETQLEEWMLKPAPEETMERAPSMKGEESQIKLYAPEEGIEWIATPLVEEPAPRGSFVHGTFINTTKKSMIDPVVTIIGSLQQAQDHYQEHLEEQQHQEEHLKETEEDDEERHELGDEDEGMVGNFDESTLHTPLLPQRTDSKRQNSGAFEGDIENQIQARRHHSAVSHGSMHRHGSMPESIGSVGIGGGWQLAWQWVEPEGPAEEGGFKRVFLLQEHGEAARPSGISTVSLPGVPEGEGIAATAIVGQPAQYLKESVDVVGPVMLHPAQTALLGPAWSDLLVGGVRRALVVGLGLQILQQLSGINAVLYFVPQILQQSGLAAVLTNAGISTDSASILGSGVTALFMIPCIFLAMYLMDRTGRRQLLLSTLPVLLFALITVTISNSLLPTGIVQATVSFLSVTLYICSFVMGFGPIPNILCSEIFPTRVRGLSIGICQATFWTCNIIVTYMFPLLLAQIGLSGVFSLFAVVCLIAWVFIFLKVPETKGMPLEVISEFFAMTHLDKKTA